jgi:hypothetical protein
LDILGERWTLLIVRDLLLGPRRYGDLLERLEGITTNLLAKRLREMTLSLKRRYAGGLEGVVEFAAGERRFELTFQKERLGVLEKPSELAEARASAPGPEPFFHLFFGGAALDVLEKKSAIAVSGDRAALRAAVRALGAGAKV